jgi:hypothetical protein
MDYTKYDILQAILNLDFSEFSEETKQYMINAVVDYQIKGAMAFSIVFVVAMAALFGMSIYCLKSFLEYRKEFYKDNVFYKKLNLKEKILHIFKDRDLNCIVALIALVLGLILILVGYILGLVALNSKIEFYKTDETAAIVEYIKTFVMK